MDLSSMLNDGPAPEKRPSTQASTPTAAGGKDVRPLRPAALANSASPSRGPAQYAPIRSESEIPLFSPSSVSASYPGQSMGLTSMQSQSQLPDGSQHAFSHQPLQSPASGLAGPPLWPQEKSSATALGGKPPHHIYPQPQQSSVLYGVPPPFNPASKSSLSPTPSSHHSQTPHSVRQSPLASMTHTSNYTPVGNQYHPSQPTTPLGPPPLVHRTSNQYDRSSPHQRTHSVASNGVMTGSPAQYHPSIGNLVDSPDTSKRPYSRGRTTSDSLFANDRERSLSVSPKTIIPVRLPSLGSRHSSQHDIHSGRSSTQPIATTASPIQVQSHRHLPNQHSMHEASMVGEAVRQYSPSAQPSGVLPVNTAAVGLSHVDSNTSVHYHSHKIGMTHLLSSTHERHDPNGVNRDTVSSKGDSLDQTSRTHSRISSSDSNATALSREREFKSGYGTASQPLTVESSAPIKAHDGALPLRAQAMRGDAGTSLPSSSTSLKRAAEFEPASEPTPKRERKRKYYDRPAWATISPRNPRYAASQAQSNMNTRIPQPLADARPNLSQTQQTNGGPNAPQTNANNPKLPPWRQDPPLDGDLIHARNILGSWEKSFRWHTPIPSMVAAAQDWLFANLEACADVGNDPREGAIEIEAKIGTLISQDDNKRCSLPVMSATVIHPAANKKYRFESQMEELEHKKMNEFLNATLMASREKGRVPIDYKHLRETDSFRTLSNLGVQSLPEVARKRPIERELRLRTTVDDKTRQVKARIVKIPLAHLHIFNPADPYDCRISMNLEVNMDRPNMDPEALVIPPTEERTAHRDRHKDRLSYQHLAYAVDLTRVDVNGLPPTFELELELDSVFLRQQMQLLKTGAPNAFGNVIESFLDNCTFLMRQRS